LRSPLPDNGDPFFWLSTNTVVPPSVPLQVVQARPILTPSSIKYWHVVYALVDFLIFPSLPKMVLRIPGPVVIGRLFTSPSLISPEDVT